jgi:hypothetical protein
LSLAARQKVLPSPSQPQVGLGVVYGWTSAVMDARSTVPSMDSAQLCGGIGGGGDGGGQPNGLGSRLQVPA